METISFEDLGLDAATLAAVEQKGFESPSPIQVLAIPRLLNGEANVIAKARTGTGKTAAFGLPLVQSIRSDLGKVQKRLYSLQRESLLCKWQRKSNLYQQGSILVSRRSMVDNPWANNFAV